MSSADHHALYLEAQIDKRDREIERLKLEIDTLDDLAKRYKAEIERLLSLIMKIVRVALEGQP